jgi:SAM-dependent methyltransferase
LESRKIREKNYHNARYGSEDDGRKLLHSIYSIFFLATNYFESRLHSSFKKNSNILEYGCGDGNNLALVEGKVIKYYGIDISEEAVAKAIQHAKRKKIKAVIKVEDAEKTTFEDKSFDLIFGSGILHHLHLNSACKELSRISKSTGRCIFIEPLGHNYFINFFRKKTPRLRTSDEHPLLLSDFKIIMEYFECLSVKYLFLSALLAIPFRRFSFFRGLVYFFDKVDQFIFFVFPILKKYAWVCILEMSKPSRK